MKPRLPDRENLGGVLQRTLAAVLSVTILLLTALAVWPDGHEQLHGASASDTNHSCAVTLYAQGLTSATGQIDVLPPAEEWIQSATTPCDDLRLVAPKYLLRPLRGPPLS